MIVKKLIKESVKKQKTCSEYVLGPFFDLKMALKVLSIASFFVFSSSAHAWFGFSDTGSTKEEETTTEPSQNKASHSVEQPAPSMPSSSTPNALNPSSTEKIPEQSAPPFELRKDQGALPSESINDQTPQSLLSKTENEISPILSQKGQPSIEQSPAPQEPNSLETPPETYPGKPPTEISNLFKEVCEANDPEIDEIHPNYIAYQEVKEKIEEIFGTGENKNSPDNLFTNSSWTLVGSPKHLCHTNEALYGPSRLNAFETSTLLNAFANKPLFLESKEELSVELYPFYRFGKNPDGNKTLPYNCNQVGIILEVRKEFPLSFVSAELLYGRSFLSLKNTSDGFDDHNALLGITGGFFKNHISGSLTLSVGGIFGEMNKREAEKRKSHPKSLAFGAGPLLVFYPPNFPIDFFLGGDLSYIHSFGFEETQKKNNYSCHLDYTSSDHFFWRVKAGPSYTLKRSSKKRLYQTVFSFATNVQGAFVNRVTFYPSILFESQGHEKHGGWLFKLGYERSKNRGAVDLACGLRF